jgi:hypothetical protein
MRDFVCDHRPGNPPRVLATISGFVPGEQVDYDIDPPPTDSVRRDPVDDSGTKTIMWYCEEHHAPRDVTFVVRALETGRERRLEFKYVLPEHED